MVPLRAGPPNRPPAFTPSIALPKPNLSDPLVAHQPAPSARVTVNSAQISEEQFDAALAELDIDALLMKRGVGSAGV